MKINQIKHENRVNVRKKKKKQEIKSKTCIKGGACSRLNPAVLMPVTPFCTETNHGNWDGVSVGATSLARSTSLCRLLQIMAIHD